MARYAVISAGVVVNVIEADAAFAALVGAVAGGGAEIGDAWDGHAFTRPAPPPAPVPRSVSMAQARIALSRAGISETTVDAVIAAMPAGQTKTEATIWWQRSNEVHRDHAFVAALAPELGLSSAQLDALFVVAAGL